MDGGGLLFTNNANQKVSRKVFAHWLLLAFLAGCINIGGFLSSQRFVSHLTGFATLAGKGLAEMNFGVAASMLSIPLFFLGGAVIAAWITGHRKRRKLAPQHSLAMVLAGFFLFCAGTGGALGMFDKFGADFDPSHEYFLLALLCLACGLLNATITSSSGGTVRVTHLTGVTTDLGIGLVEAVSEKKDLKKLQEIRRKNWLRIGTIVSFICGGFVGGVFFANFHYYGFYLPAGLCLYFAAVAHGERRGVEEKPKFELRENLKQNYLRILFLSHELPSLFMDHLESVG